MQQSTIEVTPRFGKSERAAALAEEIDSGVRGDWRGGSQLQDRSVTYRAQAVRECAGEVDPYVRGGKICARVLELVPVTISPLHIFAANGIMPTETEEARGEAYKYLGTQPPLQGHSHHISMNYQRLIRVGVDGILAQIDGYEKAEGLTAEQRSFYRGVRLALDGLKAYGRRYQQEAKRLLAGEPDGRRRMELERIIAALEQVPARPARTFFEAIQSMLLLHFGSRTHEADSAVGRFDYYMDEYYQRDLEAGRITRAEAAERVQLLLAQCMELTRFSDCIVVAGCLSDGVTPFENDLTYFVLDGMAHLKLPDPEIGLRYCPGHRRELLRRGLECVRAGTGHPGFFYDPVAIAALERAGMTREQAADYANCNCIELTSAGRSSIVSGYHYLNLAKMIEVMLNGGKELVEDRSWLSRPIAEYPGELPAEYESFEQFMEAYERYLDYLVDQCVEGTDAGMRAMGKGRTLLPLSSAFIEGCLESGRHAMLGGAVCSQTFPTFVGLTTAANALAAIREAVFGKHVTTMAELAEACRRNFEGGETLRRWLRMECPRYGNDDERVDEIAVRLYNRIAARLEGRRNVFGQSYGPQYMGWMSHAIRGVGTGATPDGRRRGESVSGTLGGDDGSDVSGMTALLCSATKFDHRLASGGLTVNVALSPGVLRNERDLEWLADLLLGYFESGGMQIQFNCVSAETLREAQREPEKHRNLLVRVAGYSDRFVHLAANLQEEIIARTRHGK